MVGAFRNKKLTSCNALSKILGRKSSPNEQRLPSLLIMFHRKQTKNMGM
jgi:hypothetical protein